MQRIRQSTAATLQVVFTDSVGEPADAPSTVTVGVTRGDGSTVLAAGTATTAGAANSGEYSVGLSAAQTALLDELTATWTYGSVSWVTRHAIVGGFVFSISDARAWDQTLADTGKWPTSTLADKRTEVEDELEWICDRAFVPRYRRLVVSGDGTPSLVLGVGDIRSIRSVAIYPTTGSSSPTSLGATALAQIATFENGQIRRTDGGVFDDGLNNVAVEIEYGWDAPPADLVPAAIMRLRTRIGMNATSLPDRAKSWTNPDGTTVTLDDPDAYSTGVLEVDSIYSRYSRRTRGKNGVAGGVSSPVPASRPMSFDPQYWSIFRGGER